MWGLKWILSSNSPIMSPMSDWRSRAEITGDVAFFRYTSEEVGKDAQEVFVWDLDKTYLDTTFETLKGIFKTIVEKAFQKKNVPGTGALVRALRNSWQDVHMGRGDFPIYFITASPPQMEKRIHEKLNLDGIYPYGIFFKDNLKNLRPSRLWRLTQQVGFKLQSLLQLRIHLAADVRQVLWGDDSESDAIIYSLYSDICARRLDEIETRKILNSLHVTGPQMRTIFELQAKIPEQDPVEKIYINLASDTDAEYYAKFGRRTIPTYNTFQTALDLFQDRRLNGQQVVKVAQDMLTNFDFTQDELEKSMEDMVRRPLLAEETLAELLPILKENSIIHKSYEPSYPAKHVASRVGHRVFELEGATEPWVPSDIDYLHDYR